VEAKPTRERRPGFPWPGAGSADAGGPPGRAAEQEGDRGDEQRPDDEGVDEHAERVTLHGEETVEVQLRVR